MLQAYLILLFAIFTTVLAQLCFKKGMITLGELDLSFSNFLSLIPQVFHSPYLLGGLFSYGIAFLLWLFVLSKIQLNIAYPIAASLNLCLVVIGSWFLFKEYLSLVQILGIAFIIFGIFLLLKP